MEDCGVLSPLSPASLVPAVATVEMDSAVICRGNADTASSSMYDAPSLETWPDEHAEQSAPASVPDDITDNCSFELLEPTTTSVSHRFNNDGVF